MVHRAEHDGHDGPPGEDVDGGELVHLAHALQVPDVEAVQADQLTGTAGGQAEPEGLVVPGRLGHQTRRGRRDGCRPGQPLRTSAQAVGHQVLLHGRLGDGEALVTEAVGVLATPDGGLHDRQGQQGLDHVGGRGLGHLGRPSGLRHQGVESVAVGHVLPLVVPGPGDAEDPTGLGHVPGSLGVFQHGDASLVDDLCWGHGDGLLVSLVGTKESIAGPHLMVDVQPHPVDRKL